jgi:hypothetical protein
MAENQLKDWRKAGEAAVNAWLAMVSDDASQQLQKFSLRFRPHFSFPVFRR